VPNSILLMECPRDQIIRLQPSSMHPDWLTGYYDTSPPAEPSQEELLFVLCPVSQDSVGCSHDRRSNAVLRKRTLLHVWALSDKLIEAWLQFSNLSPPAGTTRETEDAKHMIEAIHILSPFDLGKQNISSVFPKYHRVRKGIRGVGSICKWGDMNATPWTISVVSVATQRLTETIKSRRIGHER